MSLKSIHPVNLLDGNRGRRLLRQGMLRWEERLTLELRSNDVENVCKGWPLHCSSSLLLLSITVECDLGGIIPSLTADKACLIGAAVFSLRHEYQHVAFQS